MTGILASLVIAAALQQGAAPPPCSAAEYRQFDFWVGDWNVRTPDGRQVGTNEVTRELGGCIVHEHWAGVGNMKGESLNTWSPTRKLWHQTWVDDRGGFLLLDGTWTGTAMVLSGDRSEPDGRTTRQRITWEPHAGTVRQVWESSNDAGKTWTTVFDGLYERKPK
jgi:hypothetical protein